MKYIILIHCLIPLIACRNPPTTNVGGDAFVSTIVTGTGNTINTTQIFGKSVEYTELKKALETIEADIQKKAATCEKMAKDNLPVEYFDGCQIELIALNVRLDSVKKIEARFREDVIHLAEMFSEIELNSESLLVAKTLFEQGKIREANAVLDAKEMKAEGEVLLLKKVRLDSQLQIKANEFAFKAKLKATDYHDPLRYDSAEIYFTESLRYAESVNNLWNFANLLSSNHQNDRSIIYYKRAIKVARSEIEEAKISLNLGVNYMLLQKVSEAENLLLNLLEVYKRLVKADKNLESSLAATANNLGLLYLNDGKLSEAERMLLYSVEINERLAKENPSKFGGLLAGGVVNLALINSRRNKKLDSEKMYLRALKIYERLAKNNPTEFESSLASTAKGLGTFYQSIQKMAEAEKMLLRSLEIYERLSRNNPAQYEPSLAGTAMNLGNFYKSNKRMPEAEKMYSRSLEIFERFARNNPNQFEFESNLVMIVKNFGIFYQDVYKAEEAERMYLRSLEIFEKLAQRNPSLIEPYLAKSAREIGDFYFNTMKKVSEAEKMYEKSLQVSERLAQRNPVEIEPNIAWLTLNLGVCKQMLHKMPEAEKMYLRSLEIRERLFKRNPAQFKSDLALTLGDLSHFYLYTKKFSKAQASAERALALNTEHMWMRATRGHAYLLSGNWPKAKAVYEECLRIEKNSIGAKNGLEKDWNDLEAAGVTCSEVAKARAWLRE